ncbi:MAG: Holliday junction branch migration protein RuvA [Metamycoplasmataceae bacterium]
MLYKWGKIVSKKNNYIIFESNKTGYIIHVANIDDFEVLKYQKLFLFHHKNEYIDTYYGFNEIKERVLFSDILNIQGIGPKTALSLLAKGIKRLLLLIKKGDWEEISKYPYIGIKAARQLIFEFQAKYSKWTDEGNVTENDSIEFTNKKELEKNLKILGFNNNQIEIALTKTVNNDNLENMIEEAIRIIADEGRKTKQLIKA